MIRIGQPLPCFSDTLACDRTHAEGKREVIVERADVDHLIDLLELLPWEPEAHGEYRIPRGVLWNALDQNRWTLLANAQLDYGRLLADRDPSMVYTTCVYMLDIFDTPSDELTDWTR